MSLEFAARSCMKKFKFYKRKKAKVAAKNMKKTNGKEYIVYRCYFCEELHIATYTPSNKNISRSKEGGRVVYSTNGEF